MLAGIEMVPGSNEVKPESENGIINNPAYDRSSLALS
jgi:hypothetical protein